jgi:hypothetical protein
MARNATNTGLKLAKKNKNDEFYTQLCDIESELKHYTHHFENKVVYCNCDDPRVSNFFQYFVLNFKKLRIKKLITSCYEEESRGFYFSYSGEGGDIQTLIKDKSVQFNGDGDFRSSESIELLEQCDIVVTNPPFSLFREYVDQLVKYNKKFLLLEMLMPLLTKKYLNLLKKTMLG